MLSNITAQYKTTSTCTYKFYYLINNKIKNYNLEQIKLNTRQDEKEFPNQKE